VALSGFTEIPNYSTTVSLNQRLSDLYIFKLRGLGSVVYTLSRNFHINIGSEKFVVVQHAYRIVQLTYRHTIKILYYHIVKNKFTNAI